MLLWSWLADGMLHSFLCLYKKNVLITNYLSVAKYIIEPNFYRVILACFSQTCDINQRIAMHWFITPMRWEFSVAAATRSLSASCLFTASSELWVPGVIATLTLNLEGSDRNSWTRIDKPISVAMLQCGMVGVNFTFISLFPLSTWKSQTLLR